MRLPMVDCRNLIQFCREFDPNSSSLSRSRSKRSNSLNPFLNQFACSRSPSPFAAIDLIILLSVLGSLGFLFFPYFKYFFSDLLPLLHSSITDLISDAPLAYLSGLILASLGVITAVFVWEIIDTRLRKCENPHCKGLRKSVVYDIQLESEECIRYSLPPMDIGLMEMGIGDDRKELELELKRMAPPNGRTVLISRSPCGCPAGRLEVWGRKKIRRIKK